jgi:transcriptional regulator with XRE-family HTH domain
MGTRKVEQGAAGHAVAANIRRLRELTGLTLQDVSDRLTRHGRPIARSGLSKIEAGHRRVDVDDLVAIANALGVTADRLLRTADGAPLGLYSMNSENYEDTVAVAGVLIRKVLEQMPAEDREAYEALRRRIPSREEAEESRLRAVEEARKRGDHGER